MRQATQGGAVAIALQELAPRLGGLCRVDVEYDRQFRISRLQWRVHEVAGDNAVSAVVAEINRRMAGRVSGCRQQPYEIVDLVVDARHVGAFRLDDRQHAGFPRFPALRIQLFAALAVRRNL